MFYHLGIHQIEAHMAKMLNHVEDQLQIIQICQVGDVIDNRPTASRIPETGDLPSFMMAATDQRRADPPIG